MTRHVPAVHIFRASDSMFLFIDFVRVTNCFYDYDYDIQGAADINKKPYHSPVMLISVLSRRNVRPSQAVFQVLTAWLLGTNVQMCATEIWGFFIFTVWIFYMFLGHLLQNFLSGINW